MTANYEAKIAEIKALVASNKAGELSGLARAFFFGDGADQRQPFSHTKGNNPTPLYEAHDGKLYAYNEITAIYSFAIKGLNVLANNNDALTAAFVAGEEDPNIE